MLKFLFKLILLLLFSQALFAGKWGENFYEIDPGKYYRSAQLQGKKFEKFVDKYKIKTIINLRGEKPGSNWYEEEVDLANRKGIHLVNIGMSAKRLPHREDLIKLIETFYSAERPILVHCQAGADRTGEASAIYQMLFMGKTKKQALKMLSFKYFHIRFWTPAKSYFIKKIWNGVEDMYANYYPCDRNWKYYEKEKYCGSGSSLEASKYEEEEDDVQLSWL